jgi:hypothetical protein
MSSPSAAIDLRILAALIPSASFITYALIPAMLPVDGTPGSGKTLNELLFVRSCLKGPGFSRAVKLPYRGGFSR